MKGLRPRDDGLGTTRNVGFMRGGDSFESRFNGKTIKYLDCRRHHLHGNPFQCKRKKR
jgi:hypothetical protein